MSELFVECPHCHTRVLPMANNICPSCGEDVLNMQGVDPHRVALAIHESEELPSFCYSCNMYTERIIRVAADEESIVETFLLGQQSPEHTSNVIIYLPECELCSESEIELVEVDYDHQVLTIMVNDRFRERVIQFREMQSGLANDGNADGL